jgi:hypothetical protein
MQQTMNGGNKVSHHSIQQRQPAPPSGPSFLSSMGWEARTADFSLARDGAPGLDLIKRKSKKSTG